MTQFFSPLVEQAMRVAARYHREHTRKASDVPYIAHPASVAMILLKAGFEDEEILAAALLHDVVEDTDYSMEDLGREFPPKVVEYVAALTERKSESDGSKRSWDDRKNEHLAHVKSAPLAARAIVLADKLHNMSSMLFDLEAGDELWSRFNAPREKVLWYYRTMVQAAAGDEERLGGLARACVEMLGRLEAC